ncbi:hypothetical protein BV898_07457 [Hypsibius exemplaris]|uniref:Uncharacterized protein n=1 Tax=Hypsibius exemplaris TaxID=2072580 RepID=A0A1W0WTD4_HYPEX|nr:hypothetical protein BV898_07457 [Hypsibius exemplaris]
MVMIQSCCWWNNVIYGSYGSAVYSFLIGGIFTVLVMLDVRPFHFFGTLMTNGPATTMGSYIQIVTGLSLCISACFLMGGVYRRTKQLLIPWIVSMLLFTVVLITGNVNLCLQKYERQDQSGADALVIVVSVVFSLIDIYGGLCVISFYQILSHETGKIATDHGISFILPEKASIRYFKRSTYAHSDSWPIRPDVPISDPGGGSRGGGSSVKSSITDRAAPPTVTIHRESQLQLRSSPKSDQHDPEEHLIQTYTVPHPRVPQILFKSAAAKQVRIQAPDRLQKC